MQVGIDLAEPGSDKTVIHSSWPLAVRKGDRVILAGEPRSVLHHIAKELGANAAEISTYIRPSKGFRKHIRRQKAAKR